MKDSRNLLAYLAIACVTGFAIYQNAQISKLQMVNQLTNEARHLTDDSFKEMLYVTISNIRENQVENSKNSGKIEGMLAIISGQKPSDSEAAAVWHAGYYRGIDQQNEVAAMAYEDGYHKACDDISCPTNLRPTSETLRAKNPYTYQNKEEVQPVSNNNKPNEPKKTEPNKPQQQGQNGNTQPAIKNEKPANNQKSN